MFGVCVCVGGVGWLLKNELFFDYICRLMHGTCQERNQVNCWEIMVIYVSVAALGCSWRIPKDITIVSGVTIPQLVDGFHTEMKSV
jgi:hypothetical protein